MIKQPLTTTHNRWSDRRLAPEAARSPVGATLAQNFLKPSARTGAHFYTLGGMRGERARSRGVSCPTRTGAPIMGLSRCAFGAECARRRNRVGCSAPCSCLSEAASCWATFLPPLSFRGRKAPTNTGQNLRRGNVCKRRLCGAPRCRCVRTRARFFRPRLSLRSRSRRFDRPHASASFELNTKKIIKPSAIGRHQSSP